MLIQKIFHIHRPLAETRFHLTRVQRFRPQLEGVKKAVITADGVAQFECVVAPDFTLHGVFVELPCTEENQVLFHSTTGNLEMSGLVEFTEVRPSLTEVQITLDYRPTSWLSRLWNRSGARLEAYLDRQLRSLQKLLNDSWNAQAIGV